MTWEEVIEFAIVLTACAFAFLLLAALLLCAMSVLLLPLVLLLWLVGML